MGLAQQPVIYLCEHQTSAEYFSLIRPTDRHEAHLPLLVRFLMEHRFYRRALWPAARRALILSVGTLSVRQWLNDDLGGSKRRTLAEGVTAMGSYRCFGLIDSCGLSGWGVHRDQARVASGHRRAGGWDATAVDGSRCGVAAGRAGERPAMVRARIGVCRRDVSNRRQVRLSG